MEESVGLDGNAAAEKNVFRELLSVILPMVFPVGTALECLRAWNGVRQRGAQLELILGFPQTATSRDIRMCRELLTEQDRLVQTTLAHPVAMAAEAAKAARGHWLLLSECNLLPRGDFFEKFVAILGQSPDWDAFGLNSQPIPTGNLSHLEAEWGNLLTQRHVRSHPWLKIPGGCFAIKRETYLSLGGLAPEYGRYADWILGARLKLSKIQTGFSEAVSFDRLCVRELAELESLERDFAFGEARVLQEPNRRSQSF